MTQGYQSISAKNRQKWIYLETIPRLHHRGNENEG